jgi:hypothetical protein
MTIRTAGNTIHHAGIKSVGLLLNVLHDPASIKQIPSISLMCKQIKYFRKLFVKRIDWLIPTFKLSPQAIEAMAYITLAICSGVGSISRSLLIL